MNFKKHNHFFKLSKISVLLLYIPFFVVQVFYNFDTSRQPGSDLASPHYNNINAGQHNIAFSHTNKSQEKKLNIRLNKRFHPESAPCCTSVAIDVPVYFSSAILLSGYASPSLSSSSQLTWSLRGPPAIV
jgi:hypothetical protein